MYMTERMNGGGQEAPKYTQQYKEYRSGSRVCLGTGGVEVFRRETSALCGRHDGYGLLRQDLHLHKAVPFFGKLVSALCGWRSGCGTAVELHV